MHSLSLAFRWYLKQQASSETFYKAYGNMPIWPLHNTFHSTRFININTNIFKNCVTDASDPDQTYNKGVLQGCSWNNPGPVRLSLTAPLPDIHRPEIPFSCESGTESLAYLRLSVNFPWLCVSRTIKAFCFSVPRSVYRIGLWAILARRGGWVEI